MNKTLKCPKHHMSHLKSPNYITKDYKKIFFFDNLSNLGCVLSVGVPSLCKTLQ